MKRENFITNSYAVTLSLIYILGVAGCLQKDNSAVLTITTSSLPAGTVKQPYSASVSGSGGTPPYTWAVSPTLPADLSFDTTTGAITGTPTVEGTTSHTFSLIDSTSPPQVVQQTFTLTIHPSPGPPLITTTSLPGGTVSLPYSEVLQATGGMGTLVWDLTASSGPLPTGLTLSPDGTISGIPTASGTSNFTVMVTDALNLSNTQDLSITVSVALTITTTSPLPNATAGKGYSATLKRSGGVSPFTWSVMPPPELPIGLLLDASTGKITGTPEAGTEGTYSLTFTVQDSSTPTQTDSKVLDLTVKP